MDAESFLGENSDEIVWLRLNRLKSVKLCEILIRNKLSASPNPEITDEIIKKKSIGLSSAIESALGYWKPAPHAINARILSTYYFLMQLTIAETVASVRNLYDLEEAQKNTLQGHGLGKVSSDTSDFPFNTYTYVKGSGHFHSYLEFVGLKVSHATKKIKTINDFDETDARVTLLDLFKRVPELKDVIEEYFGEPPLSFHIGHASKNMGLQVDAVKTHMDKTGEFNINPPKQTNQKETFVAFYTRSPLITADFLNSLKLPIHNIEMVKGYRKDEDFLTGSLFHPHDVIWWNVVSSYKSSYSPSTIIAPLWNGVTDPVVINFMILYTLSIIARYEPNLWYRISSGDLNHIGSLIEYYIFTIDHVLPLQMLERITGSDIYIHQPGSLF
jgi:hypothetical protein